MGDPQAPFTRVLEVLKVHGLLANERLVDDVHLVVMGDYFDYDGRDERAEAAQSSARLLGWLLSHPEEQVTLIVGNHDLARVGELVRFDEATFARALEEADRAYYDKSPLRPEEEFKAEFDVPCWEVIARDFSSFKERQRTIVADMLSSRRLRAAFAPSAHVLMVHAGVTVDALETLGADGAKDARVVAQALNRALYDAFEAWRTDTKKPLAIEGLHTPGSAAGEGKGIFYHRPALDPAAAPGRRFHPSRLPVGLTQAIGHIGDKKCRELLGLDPTAAEEGPLRHMIVRGNDFVYTRGVPQEIPEDAATMIFTDGTMRRADAAKYELFGL